MIKSSLELNLVKMEDRPYHLKELLKIGVCIGAGHLLICVDGKEHCSKDYFLPEEAYFTFDEDPESVEDQLSDSGHCIYNFDLSKVNFTELRYRT